MNAHLMNNLFKYTWGTIVTPCTCTRGKAIVFVYCCLSAQISTSEQSVSITKLLKMAKNLLVFASNHIARLTFTTIVRFLLATPINHTYSCPCGFCPCAQNLSASIGR